MKLYAVCYSQQMLCVAGGDVNDEQRKVEGGGEGRRGRRQSLVPGGRLTGLRLLTLTKQTQIIGNYIIKSLFMTRGCQPQSLSWSITAFTATATTTYTMSSWLWGTSVADEAIGMHYPLI
jgi:hypothetical protein